jgi:uncharacterized protein (TIGR00297 family)
VVLIEEAESLVIEYLLGGVEIAASDISEIVGGLDNTNLIISISLVVLLTVVSKVRNILDGPGIATAIILGTIVGVFGHWTWLVILLGFLSAGSAATKWRLEEKLAKGFAESEDGHREWSNVVANGGVPGIIAIIAFYNQSWDAMLPIYGAAIAVAAADTFASEFGCVDPRVRMITTMKSCEPGVNGGWSPNGQLAAFLGALIIAILTWSLGWVLQGGSTTGVIPFVAVVTLVGWLGCQIDSVLGATLENRGLIGKGQVNAISIACGSIIAWQLFSTLGWPA